MVLQVVPLCIPPEHNLQTDCFVTSWKRPTLQEAHADALLPSESMNLPVMQFQQDAWPSDGWCWPTAHTIHAAAPAGEYVPELHDWHVSIEDVEKVPSGHALHLVPPVLATSPLASLSLIHI